MAGHELGLFPLGTVLVPGELMPLHIFEPRYKDLIADCLEHEHPFVLLYADDDGAREIGCTAVITEVLERFDDGRLNIVIEGEQVVRVVGLTRDRSYLSGRVTPAEDDRQGAEAAGLRAVELYQQIAELTGVEADAAIAAASGPTSYAIAARVEMPSEDKQRHARAPHRARRLEVITDILQRGLERIAAAAAIQQVAQTNGKSSLHR